MSSSALNDVKDAGYNTTQKISFTNEADSNSDDNDISTESSFGVSSRLKVKISTSNKIDYINEEDSSDSDLDETLADLSDSDPDDAIDETSLDDKFSEVTNSSYTTETPFYTISSDSVH